MKMKRINILTVLILMLSISYKGNAANQSTETDSTLSFLPLKKLFVVGDFYENGTIDTIFQHNYSFLNKMEIDSVPDYYEECEDWNYYNCWYKLHDWFREQKIETFLTLQTDTLHINFYSSYGLYCLLNIGDVNNDGKDEIAFVVDWFDMTNVNSCKIYTICNHEWILLKEFSIHESAFTYETGEPEPHFTEIKGFLEKRDGKWFFLDYEEYFETDDDTMKPLELSKCQDKN